MSGANTVFGYDPRSGERVDPGVPADDAERVAVTCELAWQAFLAHQRVSDAERATFLVAAADAIEADADTIVTLAERETALPRTRLEGELGRTTGQLRMFARLIRDPAWRAPRVDAADPQRRPLPKPEVRSLRTALGPVAVFGASNFPLAFSTAGGDTAAALAAGCPVIVKAHPSHPATAAAVGACLARAARDSGMPEGTFSQLFESGHELGVALVQHPRVRAVAFTGSRAGGLALARHAAERPVPIPVYAEMSSVNPVIILPGSATSRGTELAAGLHASCMLGVGQFCTNPGVTFVPQGAGGDAFRDALAAHIASNPAGVMLNRSIAANYAASLERLERLGARRIASGAPAASPTPTSAIAAAFETELTTVVQQHGLLDEVFGPAALLVRYTDVAEVTALMWTLEGQLTATVHGDAAELERYPELFQALADRAGRVIVGGWPTGVEVTPAMVHGGPFPATSDGRSTSVGTHAIDRFTRLLAYQGVPEVLLPAALRGGD